jgi:hypothetical protein
MPGMLYQYLSYDHVRLEDLPQRAVAKQGVINMEPYEDLSLSANLCAMLLRFVRPDRYYLSGSRPCKPSHPPPRRSVLRSAQYHSHASGSF